LKKNPLLTPKIWQVKTSDFASLPLVGACNVEMAQQHIDKQIKDVSCSDGRCPYSKSKIAIFSQNQKKIEI